MSIDRAQWRNVLKAPTLRQTSDRAKELVELAFDQYKNTRKLQARSRAFIAGAITPIYPTGVRQAIATAGAGAAADLVDYHSPQETMLPIQLIGQLASRTLQAKRGDVAYGTEPERVSARIERLADGIMWEKYVADQVAEYVLIDSEVGTLWTPSVAHWRDPGDTWDYIAPDEFAHLPDDLRAMWEWRPGEGSEGEGRYRRVSRKYRRDKDGRPEWDAEYAGDDGEPTGRKFEQDDEATAAAIKDSVKKRIESRVPIELDILDCSVMAPLNPRWVGQELVTGGVAIKEQFSGTDLASWGFKWGQIHDNLILPADSMNSTAPVTLYRIVMLDADGCPYMIISVDGHRTIWQGDRGEFTEVTDLQAEYGVDFMPFTLAYGMHFKRRTVDERLVPFMDPLMGPLLLRDKIMTMIDYHAGQLAWGGWWHKLDPRILAHVAESSIPSVIKQIPMAAQKVYGDMIPAVHAGASREVEIQKAFIDADLETAGPSPVTSGGGDESTPAIARSMINRDQQRGMHLVVRGISDCWSGTATKGVRMLACLARQLDEPMKLNLITELPGELTVDTTPKRSPVVVDPDMFGGDYTVKAYRSRRWGDDPATEALLADMVDRKKASIRRLFDQVGVTDPVSELANIVVEHWFLDDPAGQKEVMDEAAAINTDADKIRQRQLEEQRLVDERGIPTGGSAGVMGPQQAATTLQLGPGAGAPAGMNGGQASVNAQVGAAQGAGPISNIAAAGGDASGLAPGAM